MAAKKKPAPKRGASRYQAPAKQPIPGWLWMAIGLTVGAFIVFLMKLEPGKGDDVKRVKQEQQKASQVEHANKTAPSPTQPAKPKYDFYTLLPESEVIVPPDAVPEKPRQRHKRRPWYRSRLQRPRKSTRLAPRQR